MNKNVNNVVGINGEEQFCEKSSPIYNDDNSKTLRQLSAKPSHIIHA